MAKKEGTKWEITEDVSYECSEMQKDMRTVSRHGYPVNSRDLFRLHLSTLPFFFLSLTFPWNKAYGDVVLR